MNIIILEDHHYITANKARLGGRHFEHVTHILKAGIGSRLSIGQLNGNIGHAELSAIGSDWIELQIAELATPSPPTLPITLILGLPRPRMLQRTLQTIATMGVERLHLIQTSRVEKSFWQTPLLKPLALHAQLVMGLEQGKATQLPEIYFHQRFRPFIEDHPLVNDNPTRKLIAHPGDYPLATSVGGAAATLAIGPEGGFVQNEMEQFCERGFTSIQLGERILRVETAIPVLLAKLF